MDGYVGVEQEDQGGAGGGQQGNDGQTQGCVVEYVRRTAQSILREEK